MSEAQFILRGNVQSGIKYCPDRRKPQDIKWPEWNSNREPLEYNSEALPLSKVAR
jgi:hypothetical protein